MHSRTIGARRYTFPDLKTLLAKATPLRSGDQLAGLAAETGEERIAAQFAVADLPLTAFLNEPVVPYETDEVTRLIIDAHDKAAFARIAHLTVGDFRDWLLSDEATADAVCALAPGVTPEMAAAVSKISRLQDLMVMAAKCWPTIGEAAAQPSVRRPGRYRGQHPGRPPARLGRRGDRHQPGHRQRGACTPAGINARRYPQQA